MSRTEREFHRKMAKKYFNEAWDLIDKKQRTADDDRRMLLLAQASRLHWSIVGTPANQSVGDWQISRIYAALNQPSLSLLFAESSLETCEKNDLREFLPSAFEGMARAYAIGGNSKAARDHIRKALELLITLTSIGSEDKKIFEEQIRETESLIR